jgi:hypothetical protein
MPATDPLMLLKYCKDSVQVAEMTASDVGVIEREIGLKLQGCLLQMLMLLKDSGGR